jgi:hypothetical protein
VRRFLFLFSLTALGLFFSFAPGNASAAVSAPASLPVSAKTAEMAPLSQEETVRIAPHRALYKMKMLSAKNGSNVSDVSGTMLFEWSDVCDGWAIQQHMKLHFSYTDGGEQDVVSTELTWEAKDGKSYNFNIRRVTDGQETEDYRGKAVQNADGTVSVLYNVPEGKTQELPAGTLFPSAHTELILHEAATGENFFSRRVFDGSDESGASDISAFILPHRPVVKEFALKAKLKKNPLLADPEWPVHLAFFKIGTETGEPDYEMDIGLLKNGIARYLKIDYGDFSVTGNLEEIEALKPQNCP